MPRRCLMQPRCTTCALPQQVTASQSRCLMEEKHSLNAKLYDALRKKDADIVKQLCEDVDEHGLHILTIHDDTVLQAATYAKTPDLVLRLLEDLPDRHLDKLTRQNHVGNTILHETAISNKSLEVAKKLLEKAPGLLCMRNYLGETALFRTARYGKVKIFEFLAKKISGYDEENQRQFLQRRDKTTILHIATLANHFELALQIAIKFGQLVGEQDADGMTALQLLSCNREAFQRADVLNYVSSAKREAARKQEQKYKSALQLAKFLIKRDTSWETTYPGIDQSKPVLHKFGGSATIEKRVEEPPMSSSGTEEGATKAPLFLATRSGYVEIVQEILTLYPQAVEHIDERGRNILHIAIKYRQLKIFKLVTEIDLSLMRLVRKLDNEGNSILHTVGKKNKEYVPNKMQGPVRELQDELLWFERVKNVTPPHFIDHRNNQKLTAVRLFDSSNQELLQKAVEWIKRKSKVCAINIAVFIATVTFSAAYTIPGGSDNKTGYPVLIHKPFFVVFTAADILAILFALTSAVVFLTIPTSSLGYVGFSHSLPNRLAFGLTLLFLSMSMMMIAFGATILLMIQNGELWTKVILSAFSFLPVGLIALTYFRLFAFSYFPLFLSLSKTYKYLLDKAWRVISQSYRFQVLSRVHKSSTRTSKSPNPMSSQHTISV